MRPLADTHFEAFCRSVNRYSKFTHEHLFQVIRRRVGPGQVNLYARLRDRIREIYEANDIEIDAPYNPVRAKKCIDCLKVFVKGEGLKKTIETEPDLFLMIQGLFESLADSEKMRNGLERFLAMACRIDWAYNFREGGEKVFRVSADLARALIDTDCSCDVDLIRPPFGSFLIELEPGEWKGWVRAAYVVVLRDDEHGLEGGQVIRVYIQGEPMMIGRVECDNGFTSIEIPATGKFSENYLEEIDRVHFDGMSEKIRQSQMINAIREGKDPNDIGESLTAVQIGRLILNLMMYLNSTTPDTINGESRRGDLIKQLEECRNREKTKKKKLGNRIKGTHGQSRFNFIQVGSRYRYAITREMAEADSGQELSKRFKVRGHWRAQWYGPRKGATPDNPRIQKPKWIEPHWKGPDMAEVLNKEYRVDGPPEEKTE